MSITKEYIKQVGIENARFMVPMKTRGTITPLGLMINSNDEDTLILCKITEERYKIEDNYKISLTPVAFNGYVEHFYIMDLDSAIESNHIRIIRPEDEKMILNI